MNRAIIRFSEDALVSIVSNSQLVLSKNFKINHSLLDNLFTELQPYSLERLDLVFKPQFTPFRSDEHLTFREVKSDSESQYVVVHHKDLLAVESLYSALQIPKVVAHSTLDFYKHTSQELSLVVDSYYKGEVLACLLDGSDFKDVRVMQTSTLEKYVKSVMQSYGEVKVRNALDGVAGLSWGLANLDRVSAEMREVLGDSLFVLEKSEGTDLRNSTEDSLNLEGFDSITFDLSVKETAATTEFLEDLSGATFHAPVESEPEPERKPKFGIPKVSRNREKPVKPEKFERAPEDEEDGEGDEDSRGKRVFDGIGLSLVFALVVFVVFLWVIGRIFPSASVSSLTDFQKTYYKQTKDSLDFLNQTYSSGAGGFSKTYQEVLRLATAHDMADSLISFNFEDGQYNLQVYTTANTSPDVLRSLVPPNYSVLDIQALGSEDNPTGTRIKSEIIFK